MGIKRKIDRIEKVIEKGEGVLNYLTNGNTAQENGSNPESLNPQSQHYRASSVRRSTSMNGRRMTPHFCEECGQKLHEGVRFCSGCGTRVTIDDTSGKEEQHPVRSPRTVKKEPEKKGLFATLLDALDEEEISDKVAKDPLELEEYYASVSEDWEKVKLVRNCIIPKDEDKMRRLVMLCEEHIPDSTKKYARRESYEVETAWMGKLEQIYERARKTIPEEPLFQTIEAAYFEKQQSYKTTNGIGRKLVEWVRKHSTGVALAVILLCVVVGVAVALKSLDNDAKKKAEETAQFNEKVVNVQKKIDDGDLDGAYKLAESLSYELDWKREKRQELINSILEKQGKADGLILIPKIGKETNYVDAQTKLLTLGFKDVSVEGITAKGLEKYVQKLDEFVGDLKEGSVLEISVNGSIEYFDGMPHDDGELIIGTYASPDAKIIIRYKEGS